MAGWIRKAQNTAEAVQLMGLKYVVLTSVNRDDLPDGRSLRRGGASHQSAEFGDRGRGPDT